MTLPLFKFLFLKASLQAEHGMVNDYLIFHNKKDGSIFSHALFVKWNFIEDI
ncbi:hypothetical protein LWHH1689_1898 [Limosilactobacillus reuteri]|uniref:Uncharacterized protein n=1 Tax=Limosilactobacillus reuteri TaxID=1598 RepID=A0A2S1ETQ1_LIMRT|nr:hypothetical protein LWHH1689_1898 [Limosilactobacillus reuteri]